jgi:hypothetical protein
LCVDRVLTETVESTAPLMSEEWIAFVSLGSGFAAHDNVSLQSPPGPSTMRRIVRALRRTAGSETRLYRAGAPGQYWFLSS